MWVLKENVIAIGSEIIWSALKSDPLNVEQINELTYDSRFSSEKAYEMLTELLANTVSTYRKYDNVSSMPDLFRASFYLNEQGVARRHADFLCKTIQLVIGQENSAVIGVRGGKLALKRFDRSPRTFVEGVRLTSYGPAIELVYFDETDAQLFPHWQDWFDNPSQLFEGRANPFNFESLMRAAYEKQKYKIPSEGVSVTISGLEAVEAITIKAKTGYYNTEYQDLLVGITANIYDKVDKKIRPKTNVFVIDGNAFFQGSTYIGNDGPDPGLLYLKGLVASIYHDLVTTNYLGRQWKDSENSVAKWHCVFLTPRPKLPSNSKRVRLQRPYDGFSTLKNKLAPKTCFLDEGCMKAIRAHAISRSRVLERIGENGTVIAPSSAWENGVPSISFERKGINTVSTFSGFCSKHDQNVFKVVDEKGYQLRDIEQEFLLAYRAFARYHWNSLQFEKSYGHVREVSRRRDTATLTQYFSGKYADFDYFTHWKDSHEEAQAAIDLSSKKLLELNNNLKNGSYSTITTRRFVFDVETPIAVSGISWYKNPEIPNPDRQAQIFLNIFPQQGKTYALISYDAKDKDYCYFFERLEVSEESLAKTVLTNMLPGMSDALAIKPPYWESLTNGTQNDFMAMWSDEQRSYLKNPNLNIFL